MNTIRAAVACVPLFTADYPSTTLAHPLPRERSLEGEEVHGRNHIKRDGKTASSYGERRLAVAIFLDCLFQYVSRPLPDPILTRPRLRHSRSLDFKRSSLIGADMKNELRTKLRFAPCTVIVADRSAISRVTLAAVLSCDGYRVFQAEDLSTAITCIDSIKDFDVLFADLNVPACDSLVRHALQASTRAVVIALAGNDAVSNLSDLTRYGVQACLQKPLLYKDVRQALSTIERRRAA